MLKVVDSSNIFVFSNQNCLNIFLLFFCSSLYSSFYIFYIRRGGNILQTTQRKTNCNRRGGEWQPAIRPKHDCQIVYFKEFVENFLNFILLKKLDEIQSKTKSTMDGIDVEVRNGFFRDTEIL